MDNGGNKRYNRGNTIAKFKGKLEMVVGTPASSMELQLFFTTTDKFMQKLDDNQALLGSYPVHDDCKMNVCTSVFVSGHFEPVLKPTNADAPDTQLRYEYLRHSFQQLIFCLAGIVDFKPGHWVGVKYNEPLGKHDGQVREKGYFERENKYVAFVRPRTKTVGHFPEEDFHLDEM
uniref:CAP-Gly domain-containing protein n=1 Tax=Oncorhynchus tshawytscha TaxID=74940 RepID=A0A8C8GDU5_ONCTS